MAEGPPIVTLYIDVTRIIITCGDRRLRTLALLDWLKLEAAEVLAKTEGRLLLLGDLGD